MDTTLLKSLLIAIVPVLITQGVVIWQISRRSQQDYDLQIRLKRVEQLKEQLREFYDPLYSLLVTNGEIFSKLGPRSFPDDHIARTAAAKVWEKARKDIILENNGKIKSLVTSKSHLMHIRDGYARYLALIAHISMYEIFQDIKTEAYSKFQFPRDIVQHVESTRAEIIAELEQALAGKSNGSE